MAKFVLLLQETPSAFESYSPEDFQGIIGRYKAWREKVAAAGKMISGQKLADEGGRSLRRQGGQVQVVDGPYSEAKEVLGGFFMIEAADYDEAVEIASDCPHLEYGTISLGEVDPQGDD